MTILTQVLILLLSAMGLTIIIIWPSEGPASRLREHLLRPLLGKRASHVLDCYICFSFWAGLSVGTAAWLVGLGAWPLLTALMTPALFWLILRAWEAEDTTPEEENSDV